MIRNLATATSSSSDCCSHHMNKQQELIAFIDRAAKRAVVLQDAQERAFELEELVNWKFYCGARKDLRRTSTRTGRTSISSTSRCDHKMCDNVYDKQAVQDSR